MSDVPCALSSLKLQDLNLGWGGCITHLPRQLLQRAPLGSKSVCVWLPGEADELYVEAAAEHLQNLQAQATALAANCALHDTGRILSVDLDCRTLPGWVDQAAGLAYWQAMCTALAPLQPYVRNYMPSLEADLPSAAVPRSWH
mmetsp:Transcript_12193/g.29712  ORF Transcript_12193/g.29712 Transcript_12193/m.29712 type:complete len:143 (+) Transcript_12193:1061-1489(+)